MQDIKHKIEAILFTTGRFMDTEEISKLIGIGSIGIVKETLNKLIDDYKSKTTSLEIIEDNNKFKLNIKKEYNYLTTSLLKDSEFDNQTTKTLAIIAYKNPVLQSEIIDIRGNKAYDHIKLLKDNGFINSEKKGRTRLIKLSPKFFDYFDVVENELRSKFTNVEISTVINEVEENNNLINSETKENPEIKSQVLEENKDE
ncbi:SMC-Scp complex subunit ScpB [Candidatus Woesearchaeota archaeon]|nr:SMC-Scp complex subunit ScpB [Candidatus Woesearchaeota archaeon]